MASRAQQNEQEYSDVEYSDEGDDFDRQSGNAGSNELAKTKHKRRSKNDNDGRDHLCGCGKRYLSYPALYTHQKQKHDGKPPEGTRYTSIHSGRGRGRPRKERHDKYAGEVHTRAEQAEDQSLIHHQSQLSKAKDLTPELIKEENSLLQSVPFVVGQADSAQYNALTWFVEKPSADDQLYKAVYTQQDDVKDVLKKIEEHQTQIDNKFVKQESGVSTQYLYYVLDEAKFQIDQALALYLIDIADLSKHYQQSAHYYRTVVCLISLLRECINEVLKERFSSVTSANKGPNSIPLLANDFLGNYLPLKCNIFDQDMAKKQIQHLCKWLFNRRFTEIKLQ